MSTKDAEAECVEDDEDDECIDVKLQIILSEEPTSVPICRKTS